MPTLQVDWISVGVMYIWKSTQVTKNHVREFRSMPLPSRALCSNLITLVWLVVPVWYPIVFFFFWALFIPSGWSMVIHQAWSISLKGVYSWEGHKGGPNTSWFSYYVRRKLRRFLLPCNLLAGVLIIQYVKNLQVGVFDGVSLSQLQNWEWCKVGPLVAQPVHIGTALCGIE
jgi:hypothetical protein